MKKTLFIIGLALMLATASNAELHDFFYTYSFMGQVNDSTDTAKVKADGHKAVLYRNDAERELGVYAYDIIGAGGASGTANRYVVDGFQNKYLKLVPGETYLLGVEQDENKYGAGPVEVVYTGKGFELAGEMTMAYGAGPGAMTPPKFKEICWRRMPWVSAIFL